MAPSKVELLSQLTQVELIARLMQAEAPRQGGKLTVRTSPKGCVQVIGLARKFGVTLYPEVWYALLEESMRERILDTIKSGAEHGTLSFKRGIPELGIEPNEFQAVE